MRIILAVVLLLLAATPGAARALPHFTGPAEAIAAADRASSQGVKARVDLVVRSTGKGRAFSFLNSAEDYRDPDNLSVQVSRGAAAALARRYGAPVEDWFKGRRVTVEGVVLRVPVGVLVAGRQSGRGYFQHRIVLKTAAQLISVE